MYFKTLISESVVQLCSYVYVSRSDDVILTLGSMYLRLTLRQVCTLQCNGVNSVLLLYNTCVHMDVYFQESVEVDAFVQSR